MSLNGLIDAVMKGDDKHFVFIYRQAGNGRTYPVRYEISEEQYQERIDTLDVAYHDGDYVAFDVVAQQARRDELEDERHAEWVDNQRLEEVGTGRV